MKCGLLMALILLIVAGCGVFDPRKAAAPTTFSSGFATYQDVLSELENIYISDNAQNMNALLSDNGYLFEGDSLDSIAVGALFRTWGKQKETQVTATLLSNPLFAIAPAGFNTQSAVLYSSSDSVVVEWTYNLTRKDSAHIRGISDFTLTRALSRFYLTHWKDRPDPSSTAAEISWGRWKMGSVQ